MKCTTCGQAFEPKHPRGRFCSARCRAVAWRKAQLALPVAEARAIRASLTAALEAVWEAKATLEKYGGR